MQSSFNSLTSNNEVIALPLEHGDVTYYPRWLSNFKADDYLNVLQSELKWRQDNIKLFGKSVPIPRLQAWYGDTHCVYSYSGLKLVPQAFTPSLAALANKLQTQLNASFNCVLCNWYRDGQDSMSMHADDEPELGFRPVIASVTLGEARNFDFKHKMSGEKYRLCLEHGSLLVMAGDTQRNYLHGISKTKRLVAPRINLTYRYIAPT